jgi:hypothetical protein
MIWLATLVVSMVGIAAPAPQHSKVNATANSAPTGVEFKFVVEANKNMTITFDAPWTLELVNAKDLEFASNRYGKAELDEKLPGFVVKTAKAPSVDKGEVEYKLVAFICTKDKTQCYREVHSGKVGWKK